MASKTISLEESAYRLLLQAKRGDESFSMVVTRLLQPQDDPM
ncbi:MAG: antitoxin VapB family protein, partial [Thermoplasmatota archaeon]